MKPLKPPTELTLFVTAVQGKYKANTKEWKENNKSADWGDQFEFHYSDGEKIVFELWGSSGKKPTLITALETGFTTMKKAIFRGNSKLGLVLPDGTLIGSLFFDWINPPAEEDNNTQPNAENEADVKKSTSNISKSYLS